MDSFRELVADSSRSYVERYAVLLLLLLRRDISG